MNRSSQVAQVLSALRDGRAETLPRSQQAPMKFLVFEDNGGDYRWTLVVAGGEHLAQSGRFSPYQEAIGAAHIARAGAASAVIEDHHADTVPNDMSAEGRSQSNAMTGRQSAGRTKAAARAPRRKLHDQRNRGPVAATTGVRPGFS